MTTVDSLFPVFFALYIIGSIISAVLKKRDEDRKREQAQGRPASSGPKPRPEVMMDTDPVAVPASVFFPVETVEVDDVPSDFDRSRDEFRGLRNDFGGDLNDSDPVSEEVEKQDEMGSLSGSGPRKRLTGKDLRRAIVLTEILGTPRAMRRYRPTGLGVSFRSPN